MNYFLKSINQYVLLFFIIPFCCFSKTAIAQASVTKSILFFGAKADGKTNNTKAFEDAAAFFNSRAGNGKLLIPKGIYIVGRQAPSGGKKNKNAYKGVDIFRLENCSNMVIEGAAGSVIKYTGGMRLGSFDGLSGNPYLHNDPAMPDPTYAATIGHCFYFYQCNNIRIKGIKLNGNNPSINFGGRYDDAGIQLPHYGIFIHNSRVVSVENISAGYFGLDGISVSNAASEKADSIIISNAVFEYNCRQGLSWVGGNQLIVKNCGFNHSGRSKYQSPPSAGVDIEAEKVSVSGGRFYNCNFINNTGCGLLASTGNVSDCQFFNCTFWGTTTYAVWVTKPSFTFTGCRIYGSFVHGYNASNNNEATCFIQCTFEDKKYRGKIVFSSFLIESNGARRMHLDNCTLIANLAKPGWISIDNQIASEEKIVMNNCKVIVKGAGYKKGDFILLLSGVKFFNNTVEFKDPNARKMGYWPNACCTGIEDLGGNKTIYN